MLKKFPSEEMNGTKNVRSFVSGAPTSFYWTSQSFSLNFQFLYKLKQQVRLLKIVFEIFHFQFLVFLLKFLFLFNKMHELFEEKIPFKIKVIEKPLLPDLWFLSSYKKFNNSVISLWLGAPQNLNCCQIYLT